MGLNPKKKELKIKKMWTHQRTNPKLIIAFSLYGNKKLYTHGAIANVELANVVYPNWTCRFYVDDSVPKGITNKLLSLGAQVYFVEKNNFLTDRQRSLWRFLALGEVCRVIFRDTDSRVNMNEKYAVDQWRLSGRKWSRIWDYIHPDEGHNNPVMAGMFGAVSTYKRSLKDIEFKDFDDGLWSDSVKPLMPNINTMLANWKVPGYRSDEFFLMKHIIPMMTPKNSHFMGCGIESAPLQYMQFSGKDIKYIYDDKENKYRIKYDEEKVQYKDFDKFIFPFNLRSTYIGQGISVTDPKYAKPNWHKEFIELHPNELEDCGWE